MPENNIVAVLTTINEPSSCVLSLVEILRSLDVPLVVIGDVKGPVSFSITGAQFISRESQRDLSFRLERLLPENHYARKNLGYLVAMQMGADCIYETDDDNRPLDTWRIRKRAVDAQVATGSGWVNVYRHFLDEIIWPRGFPLDQVRESGGDISFTENAAVHLSAPIQQGLTNGSPDVDAVWRLTIDKEITFNNRPSIYLPKGAWCPFNSQSTWWWRPAMPLMYLPSHCSFRMTDIWRSFVAQRCLWALGSGLIFHPPEVYQDRNVHNLMKDFEDEIPGYLGNNSIVDLLDKISLEPGARSIKSNLTKCYEMLCRAKYVGAEELKLVDAWCRDVSEIIEHA